MTSNAFAVSVDDVSKRYRLGAREPRSESLVGAVASRTLAPLRNFRRLRQLHRFDADDESRVLWALRNVSFDVEPGEVVGLIGGNGAGKSTLLKILSRVTDPTAGRALLRGRVASLLEVGTGFHSDLTGRDNVFLNGTMLGMRRRDIAARFDEIVEFSGIEQFIDTPVKRYSSGMYVRLAFAVAAHVEPDVLIADEVLAVGDAEFQRKCLGKLRETAGSGRTVLFVSHNQSAVASLCSRVIWLERGAIRRDGDVQSVASEYLRTAIEHAGADLEARTDRVGTGALRFCRAELRTADGDPSVRVDAGGAASLVVTYSAPQELKDVVLELLRRLLDFGTSDDPEHAVGVRPGGRTAPRGDNRLQCARAPAERRRLRVDAARLGRRNSCRLDLRRGAVHGRRDLVLPNRAPSLDAGRLAAPP